jgi:TDG/mug DNA glycosylase family protein
VLKDRVAHDVRILFVGINPGVRSAAVRHHFAGHSNRFWKLLFESGLVPERIRAEDDGRIVEWGYGITNLIPRMTPGIDTLRPEEYQAGMRALRRKVRRWRPAVVVFLGVTLCRAVFARRPAEAVAVGRQDETFEGAAVFVIPNPSGRNASYSYGEMLEAFADLRRQAGDSPARASERSMADRDRAIASRKGQRAQVPAPSQPGPVRTRRSSW